MQWQVKLSSHLGDGPHFLVLVSSSPSKSRLPPGPARLHVQERGFCLTTAVPPRVAGEWLISNLRRYGVVEGRFCFEGGSRCGKGEGLHVLVTDQGEDITSTLKIAAMGQLHASRRRPISRNMSGKYHKTNFENLQYLFIIISAASNHVDTLNTRYIDD